MPDISWMKEFLSDEAYNNISHRLQDVYDTIHPPNLVSKQLNLLLKVIHYLRISYKKGSY